MLLIIDLRVTNEWFTANKAIIYIVYMLLIIDLRVTNEWFTANKAIIYIV